MKNLKKVLCKNILKIITIFIIGFVSRWFINDFFGINVFKDYTEMVSIFYYLYMSTITVFINESFSNIDLDISKLNIKFSDLILGIKNLLSNFINDNKFKMGPQEDGLSPKDNTSGDKGGKSLVSPISKMEGTSSSQSQAGSTSQAQGDPMSIASVLNPSSASSSSAQPPAGSSSSQNPPSTNPPYDPSTSFPESLGDTAAWLEYKRSQHIADHPGRRTRYPSLRSIGITDDDTKCVNLRTRQILVDFILRNPESEAFRQLTDTAGGYGLNYSSIHQNNWPKVLITNVFINALRDSNLNVDP
nr:hypothetical protein MFU62_mgp03 [Macrophomina phaseolina]QTT58101.1 hypothetical protein [Macrophomina phaseolina]